MEPTSMTSEEKITCTCCGRSFEDRETIPAHAIRHSISELIRAECPNWNEEGSLCRSCLDRFRRDYVTDVLAKDEQELSKIELEVVSSLERQELVTKDTEAAMLSAQTFGERVADKVASFGGSWTFIGLFAAVLAIWITFNSAAQIRFDPFPFILLNLVLSCLAAIQAPVIMMSQNRQEAKDRVRSIHDYKVNLKAELEIQQLHEKIDHLLSVQMRRLMEVQELQMEMLAAHVREEK